MSLLLDTNDLKDQKISYNLMKSIITNEAPTVFNKKSNFLDNDINRYLNRSKKKKCTICPINLSLSSSVQSTINTLNSFTLKDNSKLNKFFKDISLSNSYKHNDSGKSFQKLKKPKTDDMKFLYSIFFNYNEESNLNLSSINEKEEINNFRTNKNEYNLNKLRNYLVMSQIEFNEGGDLILIKNNKNIPFLIDFYIMKKLEDLIARYSLIIFLFIKSNDILEAKNIFLLMIKENSKYFNYIEEKIQVTFSKKEKNITINLKDSYKMSYQLIKIYSFIIRYSQIFNIMRYRNKYMGKYYQIMYLNYHQVLNMANFHNYNYETENQINYWFSFYLSYANYFSILNYSSLTTSITLNNMILSLYQDSDEYLLTKSEKKLLLKTLYNQGLILYIIDKKEEALFTLKQAVQNMKILEDRMRLTKKESHQTIKNNKLNSSNKLEVMPCHDLKQKEKKINYNSTMPIKLKRSAQEKNGYFNKMPLNLMKSMKSHRISFSNLIYEEIENACKNLIKQRINLSDIKLLIEYGIDNGKLSTNEINELEKKNTFLKFKKSESTVGAAKRNSQNLHSTNKIAEFEYPKYLIEPLLLKIELLIVEIEINKKNINEAYEHILKCFFLLILLKFSKLNEYQNEYIRIKKVLYIYLKIIDIICDEKIFESNYSESDGHINSNGGTLINLNLNNNFEGNKKTNNEEKIIKEFEKFFIFLNTLSLYQIKILNETQPENVKRNDLPILFSSQFKDCLSNIQRIQLDNLQTMALSRFILLRNPNRWILPNNLNTKLLNKIEKKETEISNFNVNYIKNLKNFKIHSLKSQKREYNIYKKILLSKNITHEIKEFLKKNIELAFKILKKSSDEEIKYIVSYPSLLIVPIKKYLKKMKKHGCKTEYNNEFLLNHFNNENNFLGRYDCRKSTKPDFDSFSFYNILLNTGYIIQKKKYTITKKIIRKENRGRRRNKSTGNVFINQNIIDNINQSSFINDIKGTKDYNDSFEDYKLSIDCSFYDDK